MFYYSTDSFTIDKHIGQECFAKVSKRKLLAYHNVRAFFINELSQVDFFQIVSVCYRAYERMNWNGVQNCDAL